MADRITEIEDQVKEIRKSVSEVREKIFNGFSTTIEATHKEVKELKKLQQQVAELKMKEDKEFRLATCPLKDEMAKKIEKRFYAAVAAATLVLSTVTIVTNIIGG